MFIFMKFYNNCKLWALEIESQSINLVFITFIKKIIKTKKK